MTDFFNTISHTGVEHICNDSCNPENTLLVKLNRSKTSVQILKSCKDNQDVINVVWELVHPDSYCDGELNFLIKDVIKGGK